MRKMVFRLAFRSSGSAGVRCDYSLSLNRLTKLSMPIVDHLDTEEMIYMRWSHSFLLFCIIWIISIHSAAQESNCSLPSESWQYASPEEVGLDNSALLAGEAMIP